MEDEAISDAVLRDIWKGVRIMREHRIAHRDLRLANVMLAPDGRPWFIDFGFAELAATDQMLDTDVAELLSSTALKVGVHRSVDTAIAVIGKEAVASAAPRIQPLALSTATRKSLTARKPLCDDLRKYAGEASGAGDVEPQDLQRIKPRTVLVFVSLAIAFYLLIPQLADVSGVWSKLRQADWMWGLYALAASALTYVGAAVGLIGAVPPRIPSCAPFASALAGSFVNRIVPARVGGIATNVRFLQKQGLDLAVASSSVGLQQLSGLLMHVTLSFIFLVWAGRRSVSAFDFLPSGQTVLIGLTVILALSGLLVPAAGGARPAAQARPADPEALRAGDRRCGETSVQARRAVRRLGAPDALVHHGAGAERARVRERREHRQHRGRVPCRLGYQLGCADARRYRRGGGRAHRRPHGGRARPGRRRPCRLPVPDRHLLAADPARLDRLHAAAAAGRPVMNSGPLATILVRQLPKG